MIQFDIATVDRDTILKMTSQEQFVRYSKGIQEIYTKQYIASQQPNYKKFNIEIQIQKYILRHFGFTDDETSLSEYWKIASTYWNDETIKNSIFYMKLNIFKYPNISIDDELIDANLIDYNTKKEIKLSSLQQSLRPLIILAGSMT
jgi:hypothetical protein